MKTFNKYRQTVTIIILCILLGVNMWKNQEYIETMRLQEIEIQSISELSLQIIDNWDRCESKLAGMHSL